MLTEEHLPPQKAFNDRIVVMAKIEDAIAAGPYADLPGRHKQGGASLYSLCEKCNNDTGAWYGQAYIDWAYQGLSLIAASGGEVALAHSYRIHPLRVVKQIVTMFLAVAGEEFSHHHEELVRFVLNRRHVGLEPKYRIYAYYHITPTIRHIGLSAIHRIGQGSILVSEIAHIPFGYVLTFDSPPPDRRLFDISDFSRFAYGAWTEVGLHLRSMPAHMHFPGDYRSLEEIRADHDRNRAVTPRNISSYSDEEISGFSDAVETAATTLGNLGA